MLQPSVTLNLLDLVDVAGNTITIVTLNLLITLEMSNWLMSLETLQPSVTVNLLITLEMITWLMSLETLQPSCSHSEFVNKTGNS